MSTRSLRQTGLPCRPSTPVLLKGVETLPLRIRRQTETATRLADWLAAQEKVGKLIYPDARITRRPISSPARMSGPSTLIRAGPARAARPGPSVSSMRWRLFRISNNLGMPRASRSPGDHDASALHA